MNHCPPQPLSPLQGLVAAGRASAGQVPREDSVALRQWTRLVWTPVPQRSEHWARTASNKRVIVILLLYLFYFSPLVSFFLFYFFFHFMIYLTKKIQIIVYGYQFINDLLQCEAYPLFKNISERNDKIINSSIHF